MEKAEKVGSGWVSVRNSNHFGIAGYHAIAEVVLLVEAEILGAVHDELADFLERAFVHQQIPPFAGGELAFCVLSLNAGVAAAGQVFFLFAGRPVGSGRGGVGSWEYWSDMATSLWGCAERSRRPGKHCGGSGW